MKTSCPDDETLAAYVEGLLTDQNTARMEAHLSECSACLDVFKVATLMARGAGPAQLDAAPREVTQSALNLIHSRNPLSGGPFLEKIRQSFGVLNARLLRLVPLSMRSDWRLAPIRGSKEAVSADLFRIKKSFKDFDVDAEIEKSGENRAHIRIYLSVQNGSGEGIRVTLKRGDRELCSALFSGSCVVFEDISFGPSKLVFEKDGVSLGIYSFDIKETRYGKK